MAKGQNRWGPDSHSKGCDLCSESEKEGCDLILHFFGGGAALHGLQDLSSLTRN